MNSPPNTNEPSTSVSITEKGNLRVDFDKLKESSNYKKILEETRKVVIRESKPK